VDPVVRATISIPDSGRGSSHCEYPSPVATGTTVPPYRRPREETADPSRRRKPGRALPTPARTTGITNTDVSEITT
jgi:hypothetical protein